MQNRLIIILIDIKYIYIYKIIKKKNVKVERKSNCENTNEWTPFIHVYILFERIHYLNSGDIIYYSELCMCQSPNEARQRTSLNVNRLMRKNRFGSASTITILKYEILNSVSTVAVIGRHHTKRKVRSLQT